MRTRITTCPARLQCVAVSTTTRPTVPVADVAVNSASGNDVNSPDSLENGSVSRTVPIATIIKNPATSVS